MKSKLKKLMMHLGGHDEWARDCLQPSAYRNGNECLPYGTVCDGGDAMRKDMWLVAMVVLFGMTILIGGLTVGYTIGELLWTAQDLTEVARTLRCLGVQNPKCLA